MILYYVKPDERGESENYTAYMLAAWDTEQRGYVWMEGIRKDWQRAMWPVFQGVVKGGMR